MKTDLSEEANLRHVALIRVLQTSFSHLFFNVGFLHCPATPALHCKSEEVRSILFVSAASNNGVLPIFSRTFRSLSASINACTTGIWNSSVSLLSNTDTAEATDSNFLIAFHWILPAGNTKACVWLSLSCRQTSTSCSCLDSISSCEEDKSSISVKMKIQLFQKPFSGRRSYDRKDLWVIVFWMNYYGRCTY